MSEQAYTDEEIMDVAVDAGAWLVRTLMRAIKAGDSQSWKPIGSILPKELHSRVKLAAKRQETLLKVRKALDDD